MVFTATQPLVVDGKVWLYYGGVDGTHSPKKDEPWHSGIGLATLRKDGFASLDAGKDAARSRPNGCRRRRPAACELHDGTRRLGPRRGARRSGKGRYRATVAMQCKPLTGDSIDVGGRVGSEGAAAGRHADPTAVRAGECLALLVYGRARVPGDGRSSRRRRWACC